MHFLGGLLVGLGMVVIMRASFRDGAEAGADEQAERDEDEVARAAIGTDARTCCPKHTLQDMQEDARQAAARRAAADAKAT